MIRSTASARGHVDCGRAVPPDTSHRSKAEDSKTFQRLKAIRKKRMRKSRSKRTRLILPSRITRPSQTSHARRARPLSRSMSAQAKTSRRLAVYRSQTAMNWMTPLITTAPSSAPKSQRRSKSPSSPTRNGCNLSLTKSSTKRSRGQQLSKKQNPREARVMRICSNVTQYSPMTRSIEYPHH